MAQSDTQAHGESIKGMIAYQRAPCGGFQKAQLRKDEDHYETAKSETAR